MTDDTLTSFWLLILCLLGEIALCWLICLLHTANYPAPFWRFIERSWDAIFALAERVVSRGRK